MEFDELVEHLDDLIALAANEGFPVFAAGLVVHKTRVLGMRGVFEARDAKELQAALVSNAQVNRPPLL